ncbi:MAG: flagellar basal body-associated FliL family protein [Desulfovibrio sp.]|jgi:flagellar FliL protein|nr:flagellar basal body-associated FliL family protein [Desulfovibrio sp.]
MLFLVPDADPLAAPAVKVELDLEDAPFLEEQEPQADKEDPPAEAQAPDPEKPDRLARWLLLAQRLKDNKKKLLAAVAACAVLGLAGVAANSLLFGETAPAPGPAGPLRIVVPSQPQSNATEQPAVHLVEWDGFLVERRGAEGEIRFLSCRFTTPTESLILLSELEAKKIVIRDAVYYYLINRPLTFLTNAERQQDLKEDLLSVINEHLSSAKFSELYFDEYVVR